MLQTWQVKNLNRCPPKKGGCGTNIIVAVKPLGLDGLDFETQRTFCEEVKEIFFDQTGVATFKVNGKRVLLFANIMVQIFDGNVEEWYHGGREKWNPN